MSINRLVKKHIEGALQVGKVVRLYGPRRSGKTILTREIFGDYAGTKLMWNGEDITVHRLLDEKSAESYKNWTEGIDLLVIDEAQNIPDIGAKLKFLVDEIPTLAVMVTGSSSFDISNKTGEPLVGRAKNFTLYPLSYAEVHSHQVALGNKVNLNERVVFGMYPEVYTLPTIPEKRHYILDLIQSSLLKDVLQLEGVRASSKVMDLLRLVAYQVGSEVSLQELGTQLGMSKNTAEKYLDLLEQAFIIKRFRGWSKNLRKEIVKSSKWYFLDNGIRNAVIGDFSDLDKRTDVGALWENFIIMERIKHNAYANAFAEYFFWRTYNQDELDMVEFQGGKLHGFEIKYSEKSSPQAPPIWTAAYPEASYNVINRSNFENWVE